MYILWFVIQYPKVFKHVYNIKILTLTATDVELQVLMQVAIVLIYRISPKTVANFVYEVK